MTAAFYLQRLAHCADLAAARREFRLGRPTHRRSFPHRSAPIHPTDPALPVQRSKFSVRR